MKNTIEITKIFPLKSLADKNIVKKIISDWYFSEIDTDLDSIDAHTESVIANIIDKGGRLASEAYASRWFANKYTTDYFYTNAKYYANSGEPKGIDVGLIDKNNVYIMEIKYTENNGSGNMTEAIKQIKERFIAGKLDQLSAMSRALRDFDVSRKDLRNVIEEIHDGKLTTFDLAKHNNIVPVAIVMTKSKYEPKKREKFIFKVVLKVVPDDK